MKRLSSLSGFTLVELTVVLAVIATILGSAIAMVSASLESKSYNNSVTRLETLKTALYNYRLAYNRLPCPANYATYAITNANFGVEAASAGNCAGGTPAADGSHATAASGMIPVRTLGLPDDMAFDSWGRRIRYTVAPVFVATNAFDSLPATDTTARLSVVNNGSAVQLTNTAAYVLVSGGANGHGMRGGMTGTLINAAIANTNELLNCKCNTNGSINGGAVLKDFAQGVPEADPGDSRNNFDDIVVFAMRVELRDVDE